MKKKNLIVLLAAMGLLLAGCTGKGSGKQSSGEQSSGGGQSSGEQSSGGEESSGSESQPVEHIDHQDPFVGGVTDPSQTRQYREEFDAMVEDFSSNTPGGTTTGQFTDPLLRVLVDSNDVNEPTSPDAAIYKMATGVYQIQDYEGIGFKIRKTGNKALKLSNLVLGLRGDDAFDVYPLKLSDAMDPDVEPLSELTEEWQEIIISPRQSIDPSVKYKLAGGASDSETGVLEKILGFHLYALAEECSAVLEIGEVFLYNAGEKTTLDAFAREKVNKTDDTCWWRDSTGFIVQKGVTLKGGQNYTTKTVAELADYDNVVFNVLGDTSGLKINNVAYASLKDASNSALTGAVNGAFTSYVANFANSGMDKGTQLVFESTTEVVISKIFLTNLQNEAPVTDYPKIDIDNAVYFDKFNRTKEHLASTYETGNSEVDEDIAAAGLYYSISYHGAEYTAINGSQLVITGGDYDYVQVTEGSQGNGAGMEYLVLAMKGETLGGLRITMSGATVWANDWVAGPGLPTIPADGDHYVYNLADGFKLYIIDIARSGFAGGADNMDIYYTGTGDLTIDSIFFADTYIPTGTIEETVALEGTIAAGTEYQYVGWAYMPADVNYAHVITTAGVDNQLRFEGNDGAKWMKDGAIIDKNGDVVPDGTTDFIIDLVASGIKAADAEQGIHVHASQATEAATITIKTYKVLPAVEIHETLVRDETVPAGEGYAYITGIDVPADVNYLHIETTAKVANEIRYEGSDGAKWLKDGAIIDYNGNVVADGSSDYVIDLVASGLKAEGAAVAVHIHSTASSDQFTLKASFFSVTPVQHFIDGPETSLDVAAGEGYAYAGAIHIDAKARFLKVHTNALVENQLRFEGSDGAKWLKDGDIYDKDGNVVADGSTDYVIDLVASGIKAEGEDLWVHVHSTATADAFNVTLNEQFCFADGSYDHLLSAYNG